MPHRCVHCSRILPAANKELLDGCANCGNRFFFYIRDDQMGKLNEMNIQIPEEERKKIEKEVREIVGVQEETAPVILDLEAIRVGGEGKFEIDVTNLFNRERPFIYKLEEGKYIIDLTPSIKKRDDQ